MQHLGILLFRVALYAFDFKYFKCQDYTYLVNNIEDDMHATKVSDFGHLTGDVQNWGSIIENYILQVVKFYLNIYCYLNNFSSNFSIL